MNYLSSSTLAAKLTSPLLYRARVVLPFFSESYFYCCVKETNLFARGNAFLHLSTALFQFGLVKFSDQVFAAAFKFDR